MTEASSESFSPTMRAALDMFVVPTASPDFIDRIAIRSTPKSRRRLLNWPGYARSRRGRWMRRASVGIIAVGLAGATAAAAFVLETIRQQMPSVAAILTPERSAVRLPVQPVRRTVDEPDGTDRPKPLAARPTVELSATTAPMGSALPPIREPVTEPLTGVPGLARARIAERDIPRIDGLPNRHRMDPVRSGLRLQVTDRAATRRIIVADAGLGGVGLGQVGMPREALRERLPVTADHISRIERPILAAPPIIAAPGAPTIEQPPLAIKSDQPLIQPGEGAVTSKKMQLRQQFREWRVRRQALRRLRNQ